MAESRTKRVIDGGFANVNAEFAMADYWRILRTTLWRIVRESHGGLAAN